MMKVGIFGAALVASLSIQAQAVQTPASERFIVKLKPALTIKAKNLKQYFQAATHLPVKSTTPMAGGAYIVTVDTNSMAKTLAAKQTLLAKTLNELRSNPSIAYAVKDRIGHFKPVEDPVTMNLDLSHKLQWDEFTAPAGVMLESHAGAQDGAWMMTQGEGKSEPIVVAVLDTGIEANPSLVDNIVKDEEGQLFGWNFANNNSDLSDKTGGYHGTHVAGTIAGYGSVMQGMGPKLKILAAKIPDNSGMFYESAVINAIYWSVGGDVPGVPVNPYRAKVLNMSFGIDERPGKEIDHCDEALQEAMWFARKQGAVVAVAAGNDDRWENYNAPAVCNGNVKVASTGPTGLRSYFSNYGPGVSFSAPGGDKRHGTKGGILSTVKPGTGYMNSGFDFYQGTSMASPHVAGLAGLIFAAADGNGIYLTPEKVEQIMYVTTHDFGQSDSDNDSCTGSKPCGHGIIDANNAVKAVLAHYSAFFAAPKLQQSLIQADCQENLTSASTAISTHNGVWQKIKGACQKASEYNHPFVSKQDGQIVARYGNAVYQLESNYAFCDIVGYDGIACK